MDSGFSGSSAPGGSLENVAVGPTPEEKLAWESELAKVEEEIRTLRQVIDKCKLSYELLDNVIIE